MGFLHQSYRIPLGPLWDPYRIPKGLLWDAYRIPLGPLDVPYGITARPLRDVYKIPIRFQYDASWSLKEACRIPMVFLHDHIRIPMGVL